MRQTMNNDLISREALKKNYALLMWKEHNPYDAIKVCDIVNQTLDFIDNAPTVETTKAEHKAYNEGFKDGVDQGIKLNERPKGEWIPVSERLPERYKEVIVTDIETSGTYVSRYIGNEYWECDNGPFKNRIIAWQELPRPYMKEGDND